MRVVICGAGQVGTPIAKHLAGEGMNVTVIDTDPELIRRVDESYDVRGVVGHASHPKNASQGGRSGRRRADCRHPSDEVNMVACQMALFAFWRQTADRKLRHAAILSRTRRVYTPQSIFQSTL
jgi:trk system potassium uptake protein TrkA